MSREAQEQTSYHPITLANTCSYTNGFSNNNSNNHRRQYASTTTTSNQSVATTASGANQSANQQYNNNINNNNNYIQLQTDSCGSASCSSSVSSSTSGSGSSSSSSSGGSNSGGIRVDGSYALSSSPAVPSKTPQTTTETNTTHATASIVSKTDQKDNLKSNQDETSSSSENNNNNSNQKAHQTPVTKTASSKNHVASSTMPLTASSIQPSTMPSSEHVNATAPPTSTSTSPTTSTATTTTTTSNSRNDHDQDQQQTSNSNNSTNDSNNINPHLTHQHSASSTHRPTQLDSLHQQAINNTQPQHPRPTTPVPPTTAPVAPAQTIGPPYYVDLHVNAGECILLQLFDGQEQVVAGPATITMVSQQPNPPVPIPVQVPPGHMIHQIADENGTLKHIILSISETGSQQQLTSPVISLPQGNFQIDSNGQFIGANGAPALANTNLVGLGPASYSSNYPAYNPTHLGPPAATPTAANASPATGSGGGKLHYQHQQQPTLPHHHHHHHHHHHALTHNQQFYQPRSDNIEPDYHMVPPPALGTRLNKDQSVTSSFHKAAQQHPTIDKRHTGEKGNGQAMQNKYVNGMLLNNANTLNTTLATGDHIKVLTGNHHHHHHPQHHHQQQQQQQHPHHQHQNHKITPSSNHNMLVGNSISGSNSIPNISNSRHSMGHPHTTGGNSVSPLRNGKTNKSQQHNHHNHGNHHGHHHHHQQQQQQAHLNGLHYHNANQMGPVQDYIKVANNNPMNSHNNIVKGKHGSGNALNENNHTNNVLMTSQLNKGDWRHNRNNGRSSSAKELHHNHPHQHHSHHHQQQQRNLVAMQDDEQASYQSNALVQDKIHQSNLGVTETTTSTTTLVNNASHNSSRQKTTHPQTSTLNHTQNTQSQQITNQQQQVSIRSLRKENNNEQQVKQSAASNNQPIDKSEHLLNARNSRSKQKKGANQSTSETTKSSKQYTLENTSATNTSTIATSGCGGSNTSVTIGSQQSNNPIKRVKGARQRSSDSQMSDAVNSATTKSTNQSESTSSAVKASGQKSSNLEYSNLKPPTTTTPTDTKLSSSSPVVVTVDGDSNIDIAHESEKPASGKQSAGSNIQHKNNNKEVVANPDNEAEDNKQEQDVNSLDETSQKDVSTTNESKICDRKDAEVELYSHQTTKQNKGLKVVTEGSSCDTSNNQDKVPIDMIDKQTSRKSESRTVEENESNVGGSDISGSSSGSSSNSSPKNERHHSSSTSEAQKMRSNSKGTSPSAPAKGSSRSQTSETSDPKYAAKRLESRIQEELDRDDVLVVTTRGKSPTIRLKNQTVPYSSMRTSLSENNIRLLDSTNGQAKSTQTTPQKSALTPISNNQQSSGGSDQGSSESSGGRKKSADKLSRKGTVTKSEAQPTRLSSVPQIRLLNLNCSSITTDSVHLKWSYMSSSSSNKGRNTQLHHLGLKSPGIIDHFVVESSSQKNNETNTLRTPKISYQGCGMATRINNLVPERIYHFQVKRTRLVTVPLKGKSLASSSETQTGSLEHVVVSDILSVQTLPVAQSDTKQPNQINHLLHHSSNHSSSSSSSSNSTTTSLRTNHSSSQSNLNHGSNTSVANLHQPFKIANTFRQCRSKIFSMLGKIVRHSLSSCSDTKFASLLIILFTAFALLLAIFIHHYIVPTVRE